MLEPTGGKLRGAVVIRTARVMALAAAGLMVLAGCTGVPESGPDQGDTDIGEHDDPLAEGLEAQADGRYDDAVEAYQRALAEDPDNHLALYNLGQLEQSRGDTAEAEERYREALEIEPEYVPALLNLAIIRTAEDDHDEAVELYQRVTEIDEDHAGAWLLLGHALLARDDADEEAAQEAFDRAVDLDPDLADQVPDQDVETSAGSSEPAPVPD